MPNLLILSQWCDYLSTSVYHYSISKGFNIAAGFTLQATTYYMTLGKSQDYELPETLDHSTPEVKDDKSNHEGKGKRLVHLINVNEITNEFLEKLDYILFIKEVEMFGLLEKMPALKALCLRPYGTERSKVDDKASKEFEVTKKIVKSDPVEKALNQLPQVPQRLQPPQLAKVLQPVKDTKEDKKSPKTEVKKDMMKEVKKEVTKVTKDTIEDKKEVTKDTKDAKDAIEVLEKDKAPHRKQKIGVKSDSLAWIRSENTVCKQLFGFDCHEFAVRCLDLLYVQTPEFKTVDFQRFGNRDQRIFKKMVISPMGVNNYIEKIQGPTPYGIDHRYCVKHYDPKTHGHQQTALYPIPLLPFLDLPDDNPEKIKALDDFNRKKTILIYSGRLKMDGAIEMLKNIMKELGNNYELHIFPGSFNLPAAYRLPEEENVRYSGKHSFSILRERIFNDSTNIIVHHPFTEDEKGRYLTFADIGLDFSQSRPSNVKSCQGNCKLLEYCYYGLKVVAEKNINNSHLVRDGKNGILLENIGTVQDYVKAIKEMETKTIDHEFAKLQTIRTNNWDIIAKGVLEDFHNYMGI